MRNILTAILLLLTGFSAQAQVLKPVKWQFESKQTGTNEYDLIAKAVIDKGWHLYSQFIEEGGPVPTEFTFEASKNYTRVGKVEERSKVINYHDVGFDMDLAYFAKEAIFVQHVKLTGPISKIKGSVYFMVCDDEKCLPPDDVEFTFNVDYKKGVKLNPVEDKQEMKNSQFEPGEGMIGPPAKTGQTPGTEKAGDQPSGNDELRSGEGSTEGTPSGQAPGGVLKPVKWSFSSNKLEEDVYEIKLTAEIEGNWHIYATDLPSDKVGPVATSISFQDDKDLELIGGIQVQGKAINEHDEAFDMDVTFYKDKVAFIQKIRAKDPAKNIKGTVHFMVCNDQMCLPPEDVEFSVKLSEATSEPGATIDDADENDSGGLWGIFASGFLGGFIALVTPCVFPMIPLTVSFFTKKSTGKEQDKKSRAKAIGNSLLFGLSIIVIYTGIGILLAALLGPTVLQDMATNPYFNIAFFIIFMIFAFSFLGAFELTLPSSWTNKADAKADKGGLIGIFFIAFTLVLVSFSCTGPVVGNLLVKAAQGGIKGPIIGMFGFSVSLALPFVLFAAFPSLMQSLPKSGGWLNSVKVVLGFVELALALKFLSNVDLSYHWGFLLREYFLAIWIVIFTLMGFYLLGKLKFSHDSPLNHISVPRLMLAVISFAFVAYMIPGLWGAPLKALTGILPPKHYTEADPQSSFALGGSSSKGKQAPPDWYKSKEVKYGDILKCPNGLSCYFDYDQAMAKAKELDRPLMLDFTGHYCTNCRRMEENVWTDPRVHEYLQNEVVLVSLYTDDPTSLPEDESYYSETLQKTVDKLGEKWQDLQVKRFKGNALPLYVLLDHNGNLLAKPKEYTPDADAYLKYLQDAKAKFTSRKTAQAAHVY